MKEILLNRVCKTWKGKPVRQGFVALVDDADYEWLNQDNWHLKINGNICYANNQKGAKWTQMHRLIMNAQPGQMVDHIDGNGLNNQRSNLRFCTHTENMANRSPNKKGTSKYSGVCKGSKSNKWRSQIQIDGKRTYLGSFESEIDAAKKYDEFAKIHYGIFARLNFPD